MKKSVFGSLVLMTVFTVQAQAVTPAHLAMSQVESFLNPMVEHQIQQIAADYETPGHVVEREVHMGRGKYSTGPYSFSEFRGNTVITLGFGEGEYVGVSCRLSATTQVVSFAKQLVPILEEEVNEEQLLLAEHSVSCAVTSSSL